jgi:hypothetical protein
MSRRTRIPGTTVGPSHGRRGGSQPVKCRQPCSSCKLLLHHFRHWLGFRGPEPAPAEYPAEDSANRRRPPSGAPKRKFSSRHRYCMLQFANMSLCDQSDLRFNGRPAENHLVHDFTSAAWGLLGATNQEYAYCQYDGAKRCCDMQSPPRTFMETVGALLAVARPSNLFGSSFSLVCT